MYIGPTFIVQQTRAGRIHQPGSVCLRHLGELSLTLAFCYILINSVLFVGGTFWPYLYPLSVTSDPSSGPCPVRQPPGIREADPPEWIEVMPVSI
jgi:hypothetical protein